MQSEWHLGELSPGHECIFGARREQYMFEKRRAKGRVLAKFGAQPHVGVAVESVMSGQPAEPYPDAFRPDRRIGLKDVGGRACDEPRDMPLRLEMHVVDQREYGFDKGVEP